MRLASWPLVSLLILIPAPLAAQVQSESEGSAGSAVLGGLLGTYSGFVVGALSGRHIFCPDRDPVRGPRMAPILIGSALGLGAGAYAGAESSHRVKGAYIGAGFGALAGVVMLSVFFKSELSKGEHLDPLFTAAFIGAAFGAIAGGVIAGDGDSNSHAANQQLPIGIRLRF